MKTATLYTVEESNSRTTYVAVSTFSLDDAMKSFDLLTQSYPDANIELVSQEVELTPIPSTRKSIKSQAFC